LKLQFGLPILSDLFGNILSSNGVKLFSLVFTIISLLFIGFYIVRISVNYIIIQYRTQFPAIFYISICSFVFFQELFSPAIIGAIFLLITVNRLISSIDDQDYSFKYIDAGILVAIGSFFYFNLIFFFPFLLISQVILRKFNVREFLFIIVGIMISFLYLFSMFFLFNQSIPEIIRRIYNQIVLKNEIILSPIFLYGLTAYLVFLIFASFFAIRKYTSAKIQSRKLYQLLLYLFLNALAVFIFIPSAGSELFYIIAIPSSVLFSIYFSECRGNLINDFIFILLLLTPIGILFINNWFHYWLIL